MLQVDVGNQIGGGAFGKVYAGTVGGEACAVKCAAETKEDDWGLVAELRVLTQVRHKNVVKFMGKQSTSMMMTHLEVRYCASRWDRSPPFTDKYYAHASHEGVRIVHFTSPTFASSQTS